VKKFVYVFILLFVTSLAFGALSETSVRTGSGSNKIKIRFWPVLYTDAEMSDFDTKVDFWVNDSTGKLWDNNFFGDYKERLDIVKMAGDASELDNKTEAQIQALIASEGTCQFADSGTCKEIDVVIDDANTDAGNSTKEDGTESWVYLMDSTSNYALAHEIGVHVFGSYEWYDADNGPKGKRCYKK